MIVDKREVEADSDYFMESETTTESSFENRGGRNRERREPEKKMKKLRSIKLSRMPSTRKGRSSSACQYRSMISGYAASSEQSTSIEMSDASSDHINSTSSCNAKEENFQLLPVSLTRQSSFKLLRSMTRKSSMKFRRPQLKKSSGGTDLKKKPKKSSRREVNSRDDQYSIMETSQSQVDSSPHYLKATNSSDMKKEQLQASPRHSESSFDSNKHEKKILLNEKQNLAYPGNKSVRVVRTSSMRPMRILTKMASLKSKRNSTKKRLELSFISDASIERATCSSTLKDSKFPDHVELKLGGSESDGAAVLNVCRYSYCSLHGHHHGNKPPLKRFVSMRRRMRKTQKSLKQGHQSSGKETHSGNRRKGIKTEKRDFTGDHGGAAVQQTTVVIREISSVQRKEGSEFVTLAESVPDESSYQNPIHEDNPLQAEHKATSDTPGTKSKLEELVRVKPHDDDHSHSKYGEVNLRESTQFDKLSLKPDEAISTCKERVPVNEEDHRDVNEDIASSLNLEEYKGHSENGVKNLGTVSTGGSCELLFSSDSVTGMMEDPTSASEENNEDCQLDHGILHPADSMATSSTDVACKTEMENQKNFTFWKFIYRHMVTGRDAELETQKPVPGVGSEEQVENLRNAHEKNDSSQEISWRDQAMSIEDHEASNQMLEFIQSDAIKLVQQAFDKILSWRDQAMSIEDHEASNQMLEFIQSDAIKLVQQAFDKILSEIPDHSSDDQSSASEITSDQDFLLKKQVEGREVNISTSSNSIEDCMVEDQEEMQQLQTDNKSEEVKAAQMEGKKPDKQMPNGWSYLKKIIILNRFVKSLEKVRNLKPHAIRYLPMGKDPETEKIQLRQQNMNGRKKAEEWMLDHALRQVISTLAPSQKRKVALLVEAFETVIPSSENGDDMRSNAAASSATTSVLANNESSVHNGDSAKKETGFEILVGKALYPEMSSKGDQDKVSESHASYQHSPKASPEPKQTSLLYGYTEQPLSIAGSEMSGTGMKKEYPGTLHIASSLHFEKYQGHSENGVENWETISTGDSYELPSCLFSSASVTGMVEDPTSANEENNEDVQLDHGILHPQDSIAGSSSDVALKTEMENHKNFTFWKFIYQRMVAGLGAELETQKPVAEVHSEEQVENLCNAHENNDPSQGNSWTDQAMCIKDYEASNQKLDFIQSDAIKLVQQAFDKILSEIPDNSDDQSIASEITSDQDFLLNKQVEGKEVNILTSSNYIEDCMVEDQEEMQRQTDNKSEQVKAARMEGKKPDKQMPNGWSNLKKIIILKRFVKSLEKVRNLKPGTIQYLPMDKDPEAEKIQLRHQNMNERKNAEEWMLDHALRQVISTLAPSQKRKVALLVQAFETVIPLPENGNDMRSNVAASPTTSVPAYNKPSVHIGNSPRKGTGSEVLIDKSLYPEMSSKDEQDKVIESHTAYQHIPKASPEPKETSLLYGYTEQPLCIAGSEMSGTDMKNEYTAAVDDSNANDVLAVMDVQPKLVDLSFSELEEPRLSDKPLINEGAVRTSPEKNFPVNEEVVQGISKEETPILSSEVCNEDSEFNIKKMALESGDLVNSTDVDPGKPECPTEIGDGAQQKYKFPHSSLGHSESNFAADISKLERQKYMRLWYLIYKHMVSGNGTENGSQQLQNVGDEEVQGDDASKVSRDNADCQGSFVAGQDLTENPTTGGQNIGCHNNEIIKLVEDAIDEIPLPEIQDGSSDNQSVTGDVISDQEFSEKKHGEEEVKFISSSVDSAKENSKEAKNIRAELHSTLNSKEQILMSENVGTEKEAKRGTEEENKSKKRVQRNWSNLKKLILLRRFVKALEKVKEFNPRGPRYLPLNPAPESEKVVLRHQNMEDRKNAEDWMLDYALQQVVAKLTPERKKRVGLLVEAFETVIPTIS